MNGSSANAKSKGALSVAEYAKLARETSRKLATLSDESRNAALKNAARLLEENEGQIVAANQEDVREAEAQVRAGSMSEALLARLRVSEKSVSEMAEKVRSVTQLPDPLGRKLMVTELDEGLTLTKESCPLGVVAVVFESRPDVLPQVAALALKSGNAILLKGGREAARTNEVLAAIWNQALIECGVPAGAAQLLQSREDVMELLQLAADVDLLIPRGGKKFVEQISRASQIPVLGHGEGICHVYVDGEADLEKAERIVLDSKLDYPAACNAMETLLVATKIAANFLPRVIGRFREAQVEVRGCEQTRAIVRGGEVVAASQLDWETEYGDLVIAIKVVGGMDEAIAHIQRYGSGHTEAIVTEDADSAERFLAEVDAAGVYHNASTRFADGYRYGFGAEVGISNGKLHARGPMGLDGLTTYKYKLRGKGQTVAEYKGGKRFRHRKIQAPG
jgi:glutamate-5-semialdehyde dehydrogenase